MSPVATSVGARPVVKVGAAELPERIAAALRTTIVDTDADGPDSCRLVIDDPTRELLADSDLDLAAELTITAGRVGENSGDTLFDGVVYAIGFDYDDRGGYTTVTAYDRSYGLYNGLHTTSFQNMTDGDIAKQIARDVGLTAGDVATTVGAARARLAGQRDPHRVPRAARPGGRLRRRRVRLDAALPGAHPGVGRPGARRLRLRGPAAAGARQEPAAPDRPRDGRPAGVPGGGPRLGHVHEAGARRHHGRHDRDGEPAGHARVGRASCSAARAGSRSTCRSASRRSATPWPRRGPSTWAAPTSSPRGSRTATRTWSPARR